MLSMAWTSQEIKNLRQRLRLDQQEFAKLLNVDARSVSRWETTDIRPTASAEAILNALREKLDRDPSTAEQVISAVAAAVAIGGLAYLVLMLLDKFTQNSKGRG